MVKLVIHSHSVRALICDKTEDWKTKYNSIDFAIDSCMAAIDQNQASAICRGVHFPSVVGLQLRPD